MSNPSKGSILRQINAMREKLKETAEATAWTSGPVNDSVKLMVPMLTDQLEIMENLLVYFGGPNTTVVNIHNPAKEETDGATSPASSS